MTVAIGKQTWEHLITLPEREATIEARRRDPQEWERALHSWLESQGSENTRRVYEVAVRQFLAHAGAPLWQVSGSQVVAWQRAMRKEQMAPTTVNLKLAALSSFFRYCSRQYTLRDPESGQEEPLATSNPADRPERVKVIPYEKSTYLDVDQAKALLRGIDRSTVTGKRNFSLIMAYLFTGRRSSELRLLRWGDLRREGDRMFYRWSGKGKARTDELPWPVYHAIGDYLKAAGRWEPGKDEYIFTATTDVGTRLPGVERHEENAPLSPTMVSRIVKSAARRAGLDASKIKVHTLRHTAAMIRRQLTDNLQEIQQFLNHSSLSTTQIYVQRTGPVQDRLWMKVDRLIGLE